MTNQAENIFFTKFRFYDFDELKIKYDESKIKNSISNLDIFRKVVDKKNLLKGYFNFIKRITQPFYPIFEEDYFFVSSVDDYEFSGEKKLLKISQEFNLGQMKDFELYFSWKVPLFLNQEIIEVGINKKNYIYSEKVYSDLFSQHYQSKNNFLDIINIIPKCTQTLIDKLKDEIPFEFN